MPEERPGPGPKRNQPVLPRKLHLCNSKISLEFKEVRLPRPCARHSIWSFPEPPIEFLLVGTRRTAEYGKESRLRNADVAQLVEHHLAKVDVASSNLVVRSEQLSTIPVAEHGSVVEWPRGEATDCKSVYTGSNPVSTSGDWRSGSALP